MFKECACSSKETGQVITYLKLSGLPFALLVNFNANTLIAGLKRLTHPDLFAASKREATTDPAPSTDT